MGRGPELTVVVPARDGVAELAPVIAALEPQAESSGLEVVVSGGPDAETPHDWVRVLPSDDRDLLRLRLRAIQEARGEIIAIGEDHAVPRPDWCEATLRAHREHPETPVVVGSLVNATADTAVGRGNFLSFAAPWEAPLESLYPDRPPPCSALSFKREALEKLGGPGTLEAKFMLWFHITGGMVGDGRIVADHYQDHGLGWSMLNGFDNCRSSYGYARGWLTRRERLGAALRAFPVMMPRTLREAAAGRRRNGQPARDMAVVALVATAAAFGTIAGAAAGTGASPQRTA